MVFFYALVCVRSVDHAETLSEAATVYHGIARLAWALADPPTPAANAAIARVKAAVARWRA